MGVLRVLVCGCFASVALASAPLAAFADSLTPGHAADELANGQAQYVDAQQQAVDIQTQAQLSAANERMIAQLKSEALRERQLNLIENANAMEQLAADLADAARANGNLSATNELQIAQMHAAALVANIDGNLANAQMLAVTKGREDELLNARAQADFLHRVANFISGALAETNMSNAKQIGEEQADAIHTPALVQQQNGLAMGADSLLASDVELQAGALKMTSAQIVGNTKADALLAQQQSSLANSFAQARLAGISVK